MHTLSTTADWERVGCPDRPVDIAYADSLCAVTADGHLLLAESGADPQGWRSTPLGLRGVVGFVIRLATDG